MPRQAAQPQSIIEDKGAKSQTKPDFAIDKKEYRTVLAIQERILGPDHPSTLTTQPELRSL